MKITGSTAEIPKSGADYRNAADKTSEGELKHGVNNSLAKLSKEGNINASQLNLGSQDMIEEKRDKARRMAMQIINGAWDSDMRMENVIGEHRKNKDIVNEERGEIKEKLGDIARERQKYEDNLAASDDGQEKEDLELLRREAKAQENPFLKDSFTDEERDRLAMLHENGLTEYQTHMLRLDSIEEEFTRRLEDNDKKLKQETRMIRGLELEQLKQHDMIDAQKAADSLIENANKAITDAIANEAVEKIEEENEENKEIAKKKEEEAEKLKERTERTKEKDNEDEFMDKIYELNDELNNARGVGTDSDTMNSVQKSLDLVVAQMQLTSEDIKGLVFDVKQGV